MNQLLTDLSAAIQATEQKLLGRELTPHESALVVIPLSATYLSDHIGRTATVDLLQNIIRALKKAN